MEAFKSNIPLGMWVKATEGGGHSICDVNRHEADMFQMVFSFQGCELIKISQIRNTMLVPLLLVTVSPFGALICSGMQLRYILCIIWLLEIFSRESSVITLSVLVNMHLCYQFARILTFSTSNDISFMKFAFLGFGFSPKFKIARFS